MLDNHELLSTYATIAGERRQLAMQALARGDWTLAKVWARAARRIDALARAHWTEHGIWLEP